MEIGIIGAGNIGGTLARRLVALGHKVSIANSRGPETLSNLARETGARPVSVKEAGRSGDVVIVTIPEGRIPDLPKGLFAGVPDSVVVVDTGNYYPRERRPVIKAFNNILAQHLMELGRPVSAPGRIALPIAGDDPAAKALVMKLVDELGFDAVDAGGLDDSWRQQPGTPVYAADRNVEGVVAGLAQANRKRPPQFQATQGGPGDYAKPA